MNALGLGDIYNNITVMFQNNNHDTYKYTDSVDDCGTCYESLENSDDAVIHGGENGSKHAYHSLCLKKWFIRQLVYQLDIKCPSCQQSVNQKSLYDLPIRIRKQKYDITSIFTKGIQAGAAGLSMLMTASIYKMMKDWNPNKREEFSYGVMPLVLSITAGYLGSLATAKQYKVAMAVKYVSIIALVIYTIPDEPEYWYGFPSLSLIADIAGGYLGSIAAAYVAGYYKFLNVKEVNIKIAEHNRAIIDAYNQAMQGLQNDINDGHAQII